MLHVFSQARALLAWAAAELVDLLPQLGACGHGAVSFHKGMASRSIYPFVHVKAVMVAM